MYVRSAITGSLFGLGSMLALDYSGWIGFASVFVIGAVITASVACYEQSQIEGDSGYDDSVG